jgi:hypothetical protein
MAKPSQTRFIIFQAPSIALLGTSQKNSPVATKLGSFYSIYMVYALVCYMVSSRTRFTQTSASWSMAFGL